MTDPLDRYRIVRRLALIWCLGLISYTVWAFFENLEAVGGAQATVITTILGLLSTVIYFYQSARTKQENEERNEDI